MKKLKFLLPILLVVLVVCTNTFKSYAAEPWQYPEGEDYISYYSIDSTKNVGFILNDMYAYAEEKGYIHYNGQQPSVNLPSWKTIDYLEYFEQQNGFDLLSSMPFLTKFWDYGSNFVESDVSTYTDTLIYNLYSNPEHVVDIFRTNSSNAEIVIYNGNTYYVSSVAFDYILGQVYYNTSETRWQNNTLWQGNNATYPRTGTCNTIATGDMFPGYYYMQIPNDLYSSNVTNQLVWTNKGMYLAEADGSYGFTPSTFSLDNLSSYANLNMNYDNGAFPSGGGEDIATPVSDKYNLSFRMNNVFAGSLTNVWHYLGNLNFNTYIQAHPERFWLCGAYIIQYQDDHMATPKTFYYGGTDILDSITFSKNIGLMAYSNSGDVNGDLPNDWAFGLQLSQFRDENDVSLVTYISTTMNRVTGTNTTYIDIDDLLLVDAISYINSLVTGRQPLLKSVSPVYGSSIVKFQLRSEVWVSTQDPLNTTGNDDGYDSNPNICTYDFLGGTTSVVSSDNTYEPNKPPASGEEDGEEVITGNLPSTTVGGGNTTYGGPVAKIESGAIVIHNGAENDLVVDVGALESFKGIIETLKGEILDKKDDSFIAIIKENYELFPVPILTIFIIGACVTVFAGFVKVVTRR